MDHDEHKFTIITATEVMNCDYLITQGWGNHEVSQTLEANIARIIRIQRIGLDIALTSNRALVNR